MSSRIWAACLVTLLVALGATVAWQSRPTTAPSVSAALQPTTDNTLVASDADLGYHPHAIYAPDTDPDYIAQMEALIHPEGWRHNFQTHWNVNLTAHQNGGTNLGQSLVLTWSIVPDGTNIPGGSQGGGEPACASNLIATMNARYGAGNWQDEIQEVFDEWAEFTGNVYLFEPTDDGAAWPTSRGLIGARGDIRISGCAIDGNGNTLAYNFYPQVGDMKIDTTDSFFDGPGGGLTTGFHYVVAHEHGHGAGLAHVCPANGTKLMEPAINVGFNPLQHDDIRGAQRGYGDRFELPEANNDSAAAATTVGAVANGQTITYDTLSIDRSVDQDWFKFTVGANSQVNVTVEPIGFTYEDGDQGPGGCMPGPTINTLTINNLNVEVRDGNGTTILALGNTSPAGVNEVLNNIYLGGAGDKYIRVFSATSTNDVQIYDLTFAVSQSSITPTASPTVAVTNTPTITPTATGTPATATPTATGTPATATPTAPTGDMKLYLPMVGRDLSGGRGN